MKSINLLPPEDKKTLVLEKARIFAVLYGLMLVAGVVLISAGLLGIRWYVKGTTLVLAQKVNEERLDPALSQFFVARDRIQEANRRVADVLRLEGQERRVAQYIQILQGLIVPGIELLDLSMGEGGKASMTGIAPTRESFLELRRGLEASDAITNVESPLENILQREEIRFSVTFTFR